MELGETLTITASITSTTYLATRSKTNSEVTIRIQPPGGSPIIPSKRNTPRSPHSNLSLTARATPPPKPLDSDIPSPRTSLTPLDRSMMQGWAMVSTQQHQVAWDIAWVCTATLPAPRISVMLESEISIKPCVPSKFEEIESMDELESLPQVDGADSSEPLKFEIRTKSGITYKIITNNFMTNGLRRLRTTLISTSPRTDASASTLNYISQDTNPKTLPRVNTPIPSPTASNEKIIPLQGSSDSKRTLSVNTPTADVPQPPESLVARTAKLFQQRSASFDVIPVTPNIKPAPRPVSLNVSELIKKNLDSPKRNDPRSFLKLHSTHSRIAARKKPLLRAPALVSSILEECAKKAQLECDMESNFSDDDCASNFSEDMEDNSLRESVKPAQQLVPTQIEPDLLNCSDPEIRDLCERTKGLTPDINLVLNYEESDDENDDASSCFSEDLDENSIKEESPREGVENECSDNFSDCASAISSSISSSGIFDAIAVGRSDPGIRGLQKPNYKKSDSESITKEEKRKSQKAEKLEKKRKEKEAKEAARLSKKLEKKRKDSQSVANGKQKPLNVRMKSLLKMIGKIGASAESQ